MDRRSFLRAGLAATGAVALGPDLFRRALAAPAQPGPGPYGSLTGIAPDANGLILPPGFTSRIVARAKTAMPGSGYQWHTDPDGGAVFPLPDGGWVYASNQEERGPFPTGGGAGAIKFAADGTVVDAYRILSGTYTNCSGGPTPWGTWLSCEETPTGRVWECDPTKPGNGAPRPALGTFWHEAVTVDPVRKQLYLTEDAFNGEDGRFYRFTPTTYPDLSSGRLEAAKVDGETVTWVLMNTSTPITAANAGGATPFRGAEGCWYHDGVVFFTTKKDDKVWRYDVVASRMTVLYDAKTLTDPPLTGVDNCVVSKAGELFVAEDGGNMELVVITPEGVVAPFVRVVGHDKQPRGSEVSGPAFDPSGTRLYFTSMRGTAGLESSDGFVFEVRGPFRTLPAAPPGGSGGADTTAGAAASGGSSGPAVDVLGAAGRSDTLAATGETGGGLLALGLLAAAGAAAGLVRAATDDVLED